MKVITTLYQWIFDDAPVLAAAISNEGRFTDVSKALAARLGYARRELIGRRPEAIAVSESARRIQEEYRPLLRRTGKLLDAPVSFLDKNNTRVDLISSATTQVDEKGRAYSLAVYFDASNLVAIHERTLAMYRSTPAMLHIIDANRYVMDVSDRWLHKLGYERDEVVGRPIRNFLSAATRAEIRRGRLTGLDRVQEHTNHPREMLTKDGRIVEVLMSAVRWAGPDGKDWLLVASKDVTEANHGERQLREAFEENSRLRQALESERDYLREEVNISMNFGQIVGDSPAMKSLLTRIEAVAQTPASVLISGESGTGKELVAHAIHSSSARADRPLVKVNCASIPSELFESEFFGHVKGAFTGAVKDRVGRFRLADQGTLFLDEVGEIPLEMQGKLLRALQEREFEAVGDDRTQTVDVRVISATNRDLRKAVAEGRFREDLYYRLGVFPVDVPPLRARGDDVVQLAAHILEVICADFGRDTIALTQRDVDKLRGYSWPGNVRELKNVLERAVILSRGDTLRLDIPSSDGPVDRRDPARNAPNAGARFLTEKQFRDSERRNLVAALEAAGWRVSGQGGAADLLGIKPTTLTARIKSFGIDVPALRRGRPSSQAS